MAPEIIQQCLLARPFHPLRVYLSEGSVYEVRQPEMMFVSRRHIVIGLPKPGEEIARRTIFCDPLHITRIEPIDGSSAADSPANTAVP